MRDSRGAWSGHDQRWPPKGRAPQDGGLRGEDCGAGGAPRVPQSLAGWMRKIGGADAPLAAEGDAHSPQHSREERKLRSRPAVSRRAAASVAKGPHPGGAAPSAAHLGGAGRPEDSSPPALAPPPLPLTAKPRHVPRAEARRRSHGPCRRRAEKAPEACGELVSCGLD
ncbi:hypothetical protein NDU88_001617 [Pleurodeles waltl]|uniref:Uncharacterized protein n=1 Tax=Pleurodeles waltl TaxID=8319 RepID=A0AAV7NBM9_PLEWA|nr:hypothetical protein NDU88_001617 [Pleurodeles waltl]